MKKSVEILELSIKEVTIPIVGISPLVVHAWSEKAKKEMEDKQAGKAKNKKHEIRIPAEDYEAAKHKLTDGTDGFPAAGFKAAMVRGAKSCGLVMKDVQTAFFIKSDDPTRQLVRIYGTAEMHCDPVRVGMGAADLRYRPYYNTWSANLRIEFNSGVISLDQLYQIVKAGGWGGGIGEMRPEKTKFEYGRWNLAEVN
jgi:hypothetical protein